MGILWKDPVNQYDLVMPTGLKRAVEEASRKLGCSQAEIVRTALYEFLGNLSLLRTQVKRVLAMKRSRTELEAEIRRLEQRLKKLKAELRKRAKPRVRVRKPRRIVKSELKRFLKQEA